MPKDKAISTRVDGATYTRLQTAAERNNRTVSDEIRYRIDGDCKCGATGILGRCAGHWVYCHCQAGLAVAMEHLDRKMSVLAEDLATMPMAESNRRERESKQRQLNILDAEYHILEDEFERLGERDWACPECGRPKWHHSAECGARNER